MSDLQQINVTIDQAKRYVKRQECLRRLQDNPDFKELFTEGIFDKELNRLSMLLGDANLPEEKETATMARIKAIAIMADVLRDIDVMGNMAQNALIAAEAEAELAAEEETA